VELDVGLVVDVEGEGVVSENVENVLVEITLLLVVIGLVIGVLMAVALAPAKLVNKTVVSTSRART